MRKITSGNMELGQGHVVVRVRTDGDHHWVIEISDNGDGIEQPLLVQVIRSGVTTKTGGAGLGLHNAANFMNTVSGSLEVISEGRDRGTLVQARFPC